MPANNNNNNNPSALSPPQTPLLAWDLTTLLVAGVSMARSWSSRAGVARAVCLARLCQALLQPELCLRGPGGSAATPATSAKERKNGGGGSGGDGGVSSKETMAEATVTVTAAAALESLRGMLAEVTGTPVSAMAPVGKVKEGEGEERGRAGGRAF